MACFNYCKKHGQYVASHGEDPCPDCNPVRILRGIVNKDHEKIVQWIGLECKCSQYERVGSNRWEYCPRHSNGGNPPDYDSCSVAIELLRVIRQKYHEEGDEISISILSDGDQSWLCVMETGLRIIKGNGSTVPAAIKAAVLELIPWMFMGDPHKRI
jgi:hypothetical protein